MERDRDRDRQTDRQSNEHQGKDGLPDQPSHIQEMSLLKGSDTVYVVPLPTDGQADRHGGKDGLPTGRVQKMSLSKR